MLRTIADPGILTVLTTRLERVSIDRPSRWGRMSAHQMVVHLADAAEAALGRHPFSAPARRPKPGLKLGALYLPIPWPRGIRTGADPASTQVSAATFGEDRGRAVTTLREVAAAPSGALTARHPMFGPMTRRDWHRWAYLHVDHHLRQFGL